MTDDELAAIGRRAGRLRLDAASRDVLGRPMPAHLARFKLAEAQMLDELVAAIRRLRADLANEQVKP